MNPKLSRAFLDEGLELKLQEIVKFYRADKIAKGKDLFSSCGEFEEAEDLWVMMSDIETGARNLVINIGWSYFKSRYSHWERMGGGYESKITEVTRKSRFYTKATYLNGEWKNEFVLPERKQGLSNINNSNWPKRIIGINEGDSEVISLSEEIRTGDNFIKGSVLKERLSHYFRILTQGKEVPTLTSDLTIY